MTKHSSSQFPQDWVTEPEAYTAAKHPLWNSSGAVLLILLVFNIFLVAASNLPYFVALPDATLRVVSKIFTHDVDL